MHYLIIAVLAFGLSLMGCEGKTGPAGPTGAAGVAGPAGPAGPQGSTGPQGTAGADGAQGPQGEPGPAGPQGEKGDTGETGPAGPQGEKGDTGETGPAGPQGEKGDTGETGPAGPAGPQGPAGIPDTGGIDPIELAQAHHIAIKIGDGDKENATGGVSTTMRVDEELMIVAAARAQSERVLEGIPVTMAITKNDDEAITLEDGVITAVGPGSAVITASSELAGIAGKLSVTVTKPISKVVFMVGDGDGPSDIVLAAGQTYMDEITAVAKDADGKVILPRSNWAWSSSDNGVATVAARKDAEDKLVDMGAHGTITGKGAGSADIMATVEGVSGSIGISVSGQVKTAMIVASTSSMGNTFTWDRGAATPAWSPASTAFQVNLYDLISNDRIAGTDNVSVVSSDTNVATVSPATLSTTAGTNAPVSVTVSPAPTSPGDGTADGDQAAGTRTAVISLTATGADPVRIFFTVVVKAAPAAAAN